MTRGDGNSDLPVPTRPIDRLKKPFAALMAHRLSGAVLLVAAALLAFAWANSPWAATYEHLLHTPIELHIGSFHLKHHLLHWINDGLMAVFFFQVGLEIKQEVMAGELSTVRKASLPAAAALGGMVVPALIYGAVTAGTGKAGGWGVPMATDIAFALGMLALLGSRVPLGLRVFLTALAIVDDIGAVLVIALFYSDGIALPSLAIGLALWVGSMVMNRLHVRNPLAYLAFGIACWVAFLESGVHATIAALLMAFTIPSRTTVDGDTFLAGLDERMGALRRLGPPRDTRINTADQQHEIEAVSRLAGHAASPLMRIEHGLNPLVSFVILPVFALANAGVTITGEAGAAAGGSWLGPITVGVIAGLLIGKQVGVVATSYLAVKLGLTELPSGVRWGHIHGASLLAGIGFTMALFIAGLAFEGADLSAAKLAILVASGVSAVAGLAVLTRQTAESGEGAEGRAGEAVGAQDGAANPAS